MCWYSQPQIERTSKKMIIMTVIIIIVVAVIPYFIPFIHLFGWRRGYLALFFFIFSRSCSHMLHFLHVAINRCKQ